MMLIFVLLRICLLSLSLFIVLIRVQAAAEEATCNQELLDRSFVTQCGPSICEPFLDTVSREDGKSGRPNEWPKTKDEVVHITSSRASDRLKVNTYKALDRTDIYYEESHPNVTVFVDIKTKYQRMLGFGTTLTDASCRNVDDLSDDIREKLISDYFNTEDGIGLNLIKVPIGSTKYSYLNYVLLQPDGDQVELSAYDIDHRLPIIKDAFKAAGKFKNRVKILASSATAPPDFKDNNDLVNGGSIKGDKFDDYASYLVGFVSALRAQSVYIWSLILSESPVSVNGALATNQTLDYNSMAMKPSDTIKLIRAINRVRSKQLAFGAESQFRMLLLGDNRAYIPVWADAIFNTKDVATNVAGIAYNCDANKVAPYDNLAYVIRRYPSKYLVASQGSINTPVKLGNWQYAENLATELVKNLEFGAVGWIDFNLALNLEGGPNLSSKYNADAPVMIDSKKGVYYRNPMFYAIGHLSRYVKPGSIRVKINLYCAAHMFANQYIAFVTPDNYLVVFIMNNNVGPMAMNIGIDTRTKVELLLETKSFNTFIFRL